MSINYLTPETHITELSTEGVWCGSTQSGAFTNEGFTSEETTFEW
jgi:hypothetical protein